MKHIALISGASSGLGKLYARALDTRCACAQPLDELWLIARRKDMLETLAAELATPCKVFALDLCEDSSFDTLTHALETEQDAGELNVAWLINAAGFGKFGEFGELGARANQNMVRLNCLAPLSLSYVALRYMHAGSRIINLASAAAFMPLPWLSTYAATKSFILSFSRALDYELASVDIRTTAVCPKFMHTEFLDAPGNTDRVHHYSWIGFEDPARVVNVSLAAARKGKPLCIPSADVKLAYAFCKIAPTPVVMALQDKIGSWAQQVSASPTEKNL